MGLAGWVELHLYYRSICQTYPPNNFFFCWLVGLAWEGYKLVAIFAAEEARGGAILAAEEAPAGAGAHTPYF